MQTPPWESTQHSLQQTIEARLLAHTQNRWGHVPARLAESMAYSLLDGGKRMRPILCLGFAQALGPLQPCAYDAAMAVEMVHCYSLIHDDLPAMDDDALRRGRPTNHKVYGEAMAILAGDALLTEAFAVLSGPLGAPLSAEESGIRACLCQELAVAAGALGMVGGQVLDTDEGRPAELAYLLRLHKMKTGALIKAACRMGVLAAGGNAQALHAAETYGEAIGLAFQIADDLLDVVATPEAMGKPTGADAAAGRATFPAILSFEKAQAMAREQVDMALAALGQVEPTPGLLAGLARFAVERKH
ncbi:MAG: polyprenyl synthetase family protein [Proteobacteria bacterium]|nr:polyprenyl synthetase family protein [Cystobacterineae bacterium]MCL2259263.1 polyprenyl synthetase family protein [Cystobacterineae bacterium]MCL2314373.1 polyprenyl synthetase family protein [Pseudomonadota bacterium]